MHIGSNGFHHVERFGYSLKYNMNVEVILNVPDVSLPIESEDLGPLREQYSGKKLLIFTGAIDRRNGIFTIIDALGTIRQKFPRYCCFSSGGQRIRMKPCYTVKLIN